MGSSWRPQGMLGSSAGCTNHVEISREPAPIWNARSRSRSTRHSSELKADVRVSLAHLEIEEGRFDEAHRHLNDALELVRTVRLVQTEGQIHEAFIEPL